MSTREAATSTGIGFGERLGDHDFVVGMALDSVGDPARRL